MPDAVIHPTTQELAAFGLGTLPERAAATIAAHHHPGTPAEIERECVNLLSLLG